MTNETQKATLQSIGFQNNKIGETVKQERGRLLSFIRKRIPTEEDAEDVLQDVFYELVESYRLMKPVEQLASWLFTVARNKITDLYRKKKPVSLEEALHTGETDEEETLMLADVLPSFDDSVEDKLMQSAMMDIITEALEELPEEQRQAFVMHELEDKSLKEIAESMNIPLKTAISRKRYAVLYLRERLKVTYNELLNN